MKKHLVLFVSAAVAALALAKPALTVNAPVYDSANHVLRVNYHLDDAAVVTARFLTNGVAVSMTDARFVVGDVNRRVEPGDHSFVWRMEGDIPHGRFDPEAVQVKLTAWSLDAPPDYMTVDLRSRNTVRYYETADDVPGGLGRNSGDLNRTEMVVLKRIPAKGVTFRMGSPTTAAVRFDNEVPHLVTMENDYYFGVYPVTQKQYKRFFPNAGTDSADGDDAPIRPMDLAKYDQVRGSVSDDPKIDWPDTGSSVASGSYLGLIREWSGVDFDIPTEAQWEYAARAGSASDIITGLDLAGDGGSTTDENLVDVGWIQKNSVDKYGDTRPGVVGYYMANNWGIYDVQGGVTEACRDWYVADLTTVDNEGHEPVGPKSGTDRVMRSGTSRWNVICSRLSTRNAQSPSLYGWGQAWGFRLMAPCVAK